ncbi:MAG TPA: protein phosphatase 2C domain-containing protein [Longimicrobiales bacterium]
MQPSVAALTDRGRKRSGNEDALLALPDTGLFIVADGLGGHAAGEVASGIAVEVIGAKLAGIAGALPAPALEAPLRSAMIAAHHAIRARAAHEPEKTGMATTLTALAIADDGHAFRIGHVGDSRAYLLRDGRLRQLTTDHTWVQQQIESGLLSPARARTHPNAGVLTRALGIADGDPKIDIIPGRIEPGDLLLLCSDGLTGPVADADIRAILDRDLPLDALAAQLVDAANLRGGPDNITVILIRAAP